MCQGSFVALEDRNQGALTKTIAKYIISIYAISVFHTDDLLPYNEKLLLTYPYKKKKCSDSMFSQGDPGVWFGDQH